MLLLNGDSEMKWIYTKDKLPQQAEKPYQVIAATTKPAEENMRGKAKMGFYQDWVVRQWPENFIAWMPAPISLDLIDGI